MANFTALKTAINNAIRTNGNEEITGAVLQVILDAMVETLGDSAINNLETALATEVTNRENAVGGVAGDLAAEALARANKDNQLDGRINQEEYNRQNADAALSQTMNQGFQTLGSQMTALNAAISALNAAYQNGFLYGGIATPSSSPSNNKCFYIALQGGTYTNFGGVGVVEGINIIKNDSGWKVEHIYDQTTLLNEFYLLRQQVIRALASYDPIVIHGDVINAPDEEDLTSNAQHLLKFKDRAYSPLNFSGLGMKILRKNILPLNDSVAFNGFLEGVTAEETLAGSPELIFWDRMNTRFVGIKDGIYYAAWTDDDNYVPVSTSLVYMYDGTPYKWDGSNFSVDEDEVPNLQNCLTQDMINEDNTVYIIRYDFTLREDITIPANCVLEFDGGSLNNGNITVGYCEIKAGLEQIFHNVFIAADDIRKNFEVRPEWWGMRTSEAANNKAFEDVLKNTNVTIRCSAGVYEFDDSTVEGTCDRIKIYGDSSISTGTIFRMTTNSDVSPNLDSFLKLNCIRVDIENIMFVTNKSYNNYHAIELLDGVDPGQVDSQIKNCMFQNWANCVKVHGRGFNFIGNLCAMCCNIVQYVPADSQSSAEILQNPPLDGRAIIIRDNRLHSISQRSGSHLYAAVLTCFYNSLQPNAAIDGAIIESNLMDIGGMFVYSEIPFNNSQIRGNITRNITTLGAINLQRGTQNTIISENIVSSLTAVTGSAVSITAPASFTIGGIIISNNVFDGINNRDAISIEAGSIDASNNVVVTGNNLMGNARSLLYFHGNGEQLHVINNAVNSATNPNIVVGRYSAKTLGGIVKSHIQDIGTISRTPFTDSFLESLGLPKEGNDDQLPYIPVQANIGIYEFFAKSLNKPLYFNESFWVDAAGEQQTFKIEYILSHISSSNLRQAIKEGQYTTTLIADEGYTLPAHIEVSAPAHGIVWTEGTDYTYNQSTGVVTLIGRGGSGGITRTMKITATATQI